MNSGLSEAGSKIAVTGVRVFDGRELSEPTTVVIDGDVIGTDPGGAELIDAGGAILLPGFIDAHIHLHGPQTLAQLADFGVTTGLDMATWPPERLEALRKESGASDIRSAGTPLIGAGGMHARVPGMSDAAIITDAAQADRMVAERVAAGSDYVKIVLEAPGGGGPDADVAAAVVRAAHARGLRVVAHAASLGAYLTGLDVGADILTHVPREAEVSAADVRRMAEQGGIAVPTIVMMEGIATALGVGGIDHCLATVGALHAAGVPVLAGSDSNDQIGVPFQPEHGAALHRELELLVAAGLTPAEAIRAATSLPAKHFGLTDRGVIAPGMRADLVLIEGDPLADIRATRAIARVWCAGNEHVLHG
ncbi:amidohydrolase family protein [Nocardia sp. NBC_01327]|uniref:amidohydrolase family protein n=1 Tax=Nocardia sp. NBC_01327 TaxID=2903593 RepID=UPI002E1349F2|nr:amidohydrolase family protein [Nocardia sp. NBC_01327]